MLALASTAVGEDSEERQQARAKKLSTMSTHMNHHLRKEGGVHSEEQTASLMRQAHEDKRALRDTEPSAKAQHAEKIRRVANQLKEQHRRHMERPVTHDLRKAHMAKHSLAEADRDGRKPSMAKDAAARKAKKKGSFDKVAKHMAQHLNTNDVRGAAARGDPRTMKAAHDTVGLALDHGGAPVHHQMDTSQLKGMYNRLAQSAPHNLHEKDADVENSNPSDGEE
eukprot:g2939.t1